MLKKKGIQLNQAFGAVLTLVLVAILIILAIVIYVSLGESFAGTATASVVNESGFNATDGGTLAGAAACQSNNFVVSSINNESEVIVAANYSVNSETGVITNLTAEAQATLWNVTYSYDWGSAACTASEDMTSEFGNYTSLVGLVGTIIFLGLVIGILVTAFAFGGRRET